MKIFLVGGGTGGHFYPLIAVAESLRMSASDPSQLMLGYMGNERFDRAELERLSIKYVWCPSGKMRRYASVLNFLDPFKVIAGVIVAFFKLLFAYPDVIFSKGGYTSVPIIFAARVLRIPVVIHESDARMGRANELAVSYAKYIAVSYTKLAESLPRGKTALTGIPIRKAIRDPFIDEAQTYTTFGITDMQAPVVLIIGGSSGAERVNLLVMSALDTLLPQYTIIHQTGKEHEVVVREMAHGLIVDPRLKPRYIARPYLSAEEMHQALSIADMVVSRAGSSAIAEIALHGKPSILIPIPEDVSHDQLANAYAYAEKGAAYVLEEDNAREHILASLLDEIMQDAKKYMSMSDAARSFARPDASDKIAHALIAIAQGHEIAVQ